MRAVQFSEYGDNSVLKVVDVDAPTAGEGQVLVEVHSASLNPFDTVIRAGYMKEMIPLQLPVTIGGDIAGKVVGVGTGVDSLAIGDVVYGQANVVAGNSGSFAEFAATSADQVAIAPAELSVNDSASLPLVGVSALQALTEHIHLTAGQKILITGGAGGIGRVAIQIAKNIGAYVVTTAKTSDLDVLKALGADEVIDYTAEDYTTKVHDFDAAFDTVGGEELSKIVTILKEDGVAVSMAGQPDEEAAKQKNITAISQMTLVRTPLLNALRELVEAGVVKPFVGKTFNLDEVVDAFTARENGSVSGKVVLEIKK